MTANESLLNRFYTAFQNRDYATMQACYHDEATFGDAVFTHLDVQETRAMWQMLLTRGKDLQVAFRDVKADERAGTVHWEATYTFSQTGRKVHNIISASFEFRDGLIYRHRDAFSLRRWAGLALGPLGKLLGWAPFFQKKIRRGAAENLQKFMAAQREKTA